MTQIADTTQQRARLQRLNGLLEHRATALRTVLQHAAATEDIDLLELEIKRQDLLVVLNVMTGVIGLDCEVEDQDWD